MFFLRLTWSSLAILWLLSGAATAQTPDPSPRALDTAAEGQAARKALTAKVAALLDGMAEQIPQLRSPENRLKFQIQVAHLLWRHDEKRARRLAQDAAEGVKQYVAAVDPSDQNYYADYQTAMQFRQEALQTLAVVDVELALDLLRSTRDSLPDPHAQSGRSQIDRELQMESTIAQQVATKDPKRAAELAEASLEKGVSYGTINTLSQISTEDVAAAAKLAAKLATKLEGEELLQGEEGLIALQLIGLAGGQQSSADTTTTADTAPVSLLTEQQRRRLFNKVVSATLSAAASSDPRGPEGGKVHNLLNALQSMPQELERYAPSSAAAVKKKAAEMATLYNPQGHLWQKFQDAINNGTIESALEAVRQAPPGMGDGLYQQIASKVAESGDAERAKRILSEHITNPVQRQQALKNLEQQATYYAMAQGRIEEALVAIGNLRTPSEKVMMSVQLVAQGGDKMKGPAAVALLDQARNSALPSGRVENAEQASLLFNLVGAYQTIDPDQSFGLIAMMVDQFNELCVAAVPLNGFGQQFFKDGELIMENGNSLSSIADQLSHTVGALARVDFDRAKSAADKVARPEARLLIYQMIAQQADVADAETARGVSPARSLRGIVRLTPLR